MVAALLKVLRRGTEWMGLRKRWRVVALGVLGVGVTASGLGIALAQQGEAPARVVQPSVGGASCSTGTTSEGAITVCPGAARVGSVVQLSGTGCNRGDIYVKLYFFGPGDFVGTGGGGISLDPWPRSLGSFHTSFRIPSTYPMPALADGSAPIARVVPGTGYSFTVYPLGVCKVSFVVSG
jgi:hypothetical protein